MSENSIESYSATVSDQDREVSVKYDFGENLADAVEKFGEDVVFSRFKSAAIIDLQSLIRRHIKQLDEKGNPKFTDEQIQEAASNWAPGIKTVSRKSKAEKVQALFSQMSDEEREAILNQLMSGDDADDTDSDSE